MHRKYFLIVLGLTAFCLFLMFTFFRQQAVKEQEKSIQTVRPPFAAYIKGVGIVEPESGNIYIGIPFNRIVKQISVLVNDRVKKGDVLIQLDHQELIANLQVKEREYEKALANLRRLEEMPRKEDLTIAEEAVKKAQVVLDESKAEYEMVSNLPNPHAISKEEQDRRLYKYQQAEAQLRETQAQYEKIKSGTWQPDLKIARHQVEQAQADVEAIKTEIQQTYIKSPINGTVLQIKIHEGEIPNSDSSQPVIIVGNIDELFLRVSIDQFNVSNDISNARAVAFRQGAPSTEFPLEFIRVEPVMVPKKYLTNAVNEQVDTQVLNSLSHNKKKFRLIHWRKDECFHLIKKSKTLHFFPPATRNGKLLSNILFL